MLIEAYFRLFVLQLLIPEDHRFEPELSLALDRALVRLEEAMEASCEAGIPLCWACRL